MSPDIHGHEGQEHDRRDTEEQVVDEMVGRRVAVGTEEVAAHRTDHRDATSSTSPLGRGRRPAPASGEPREQGQQRGDQVHDVVRHRDIAVVSEERSQ